jgi:hypothetical protein
VAIPSRRQPHRVTADLLFFEVDFHRCDFQPDEELASRTQVSPLDDLAPLEKKLDLLIGLFRIAYHEPIEAERQAILGEPVSKTILELSGDWIEAGKLKTAVAKKTNVSVPTVSRRLAELAARGILSRAGGGPNVRYRSTGLLDV